MMNARGIAASGDVLSQRALNRALLARQLLPRHEKRSVLETIEHLVGMQAQVPGNLNIVLRSRLDGFQPEELSRSIAERQAVRTSLMRATIHLVTGRDCISPPSVRRPARTSGSGSHQDTRCAGAGTAGVAKVPTRVGVPTRGGSSGRALRPDAGGSDWRRGGPSARRQSRTRFGAEEPLIERDTIHWA